MPLSITDTRHLFRPLSADILAVLRSLSPEDWERPLATGTWRVRDVAAHLLDTALRRLSFHRDRQTPPPPTRPVATARELVAFVNELNATWIDAAGRLSPRVLADLYARASADLADFVENLSADAPAFFPVSWAGEAASAGWLDIGRELTEVWHHGAQIREAAGAGPFTDARWLQAVLRIALHVMPRAYRDVPGRSGQSVAIEITGASGGTWALRRAGDRWDISEGDQAAATTRATMSDDTAWRLFFNGLTRPTAESLIRLEGDVDLGRPLVDARSVIV